ncbi:sigma-54-dependent transcriptional regulator [Pseudodesulfovibrio sediminis]|uniref:Sigma-54-dependent Fis family transcriptional regulator n=1 Tax=Pseudodesulfovibrio sediminis TaxID=2810563 RepID=A0ABN6EXI2_9BACT|nr:sigma-54 dependent transcriptional regulator [Pseudodesulfovibrio sediminis]BCS89841.1 sigma-54-dependent Fis family transcriptional regulator [Pseudodesulfovibrio sediminis]
MPGENGAEPKRTSPRYPVLLVDDEESWLRSFQSALRASGVNNVVTLSDSRLVLETLERESFCAVAVDLMMPHISGEELIPKILSEYPELPLLVISGLDQVKTAVKCIRMGAFDFIVKTESRNTLIAGIKHAIEIFELRQENSSLRERLFSDDLLHPEYFEEIITTDKTMRTIFQYVEAIAESSRSVLVTGESGVGKEVIARAIHRASERSGEFVAVNMAGLDDNMVADTLFGHKKGAYTGATHARAGLVETASDGTLFLDEIGDLSLESQKKLLRLLQENEYTPLGSDISRKCTARVVAATHRDLNALQEQGKFRRDLFYRLRGHMLTLPPLRERLADLPLLIRYFAQEAAVEFDKPLKTDIPGIVRLLHGYDFPGNIRELRLFIHDAARMATGGRLTPETFEKLLHFDAQIRVGVGRDVPPSETLTFGAQLPSLKDARTMLIQEALKRTANNQSMAAQLLGVSRQAINKYLQSASDKNS